MPSRDGKLFFIASTRPGGVGGRDIRVSARTSENSPWGEPTLVGEPISTVYNDFCPMLAGDGKTFFFVSDRPGGCGGTDIYVARRNRDGSFTAPRKPLGCSVNSAGNEEGPVPGIEARRGVVLYFSSARPGGFAAEAPGVAPDFDLYVTSWRAGGFQAPELVPGVNSDAQDGQPFLSDDSRELFFYSNRPGGQGGNDIWVASRRRSRRCVGCSVESGTEREQRGAGDAPVALVGWDASVLRHDTRRAGRRRVVGPSPWRRGGA